MTSGAGRRKIEVDQVVVRGRRRIFPQGTVNSLAWVSASPAGA